MKKENVRSTCTTFKIGTINDDETVKELIREQYFTKYSR